ncbi:cytochrome C [Oscillatoria sp. FACHB-1406]|uniref:cytochrome C n=1 Tax=Oscillatoria sp. FACHB-1406 TaxID=2692846 RepID=UPI0016870826|nr:cytochrome C [Oscillatoria sp. FACHB-1406]MBD2578124.1 cytochrome C [Oscillatoria sp. FACHB-1406]
MAQRKSKKRSPSILILIILLWSALIGWGGAMAMAKGNPTLNVASGEQLLASVDPTPARAQLGLQVYRDRCGSCHLAIPPEIFPMQTWQQLLQKPQEHYGTSLKSIIRPELRLMWEYLSTASRPLQEGETIPYRFGNSHYFKILHPRVPLPNPISHTTCVSCHLGAKNFDFRSLTPEWENSP